MSICKYVYRSIALCYSMRDKNRYKYILRLAAVRLLVDMPVNVEIHAWVCLCANAARHHCLPAYWVISPHKNDEIIITHDWGRCQSLEICDREEPEHIDTKSWVKFIYRNPCAYPRTLGSVRAIISRCRDQMCSAMGKKLVGLCEGSQTFGFHGDFDFQSNTITNWNHRGVYCLTHVEFYCQLIWTISHNCYRCIRYFKVFHMHSFHPYIPEARRKQAVALVPRRVCCCFLLERYVCKHRFMNIGSGWTVKRVPQTLAQEDFALVWLLHHGDGEAAGLDTCFTSYDLGWSILSGSIWVLHLIVRPVCFFFYFRQETMLGSHTHRQRESTMTGLRTQGLRIPTPDLAKDYALHLQLPQSLAMTCSLATDSYYRSRTN